MFITLQAAGGSGTPMVIMMALIFAVMYFFMIRPQNKKQKEIQNFRNSLTIGSEVVTAGGIYGTVRHINEEKNILEIEVASGVKIKVDRNSVYATASDTTATAQK